jgi:HK97 gp10 family phage protein
VSLQLKGGADLQKFLDSLPADVEKNVMRGGLRAGAKVLKDEAVEFVPVNTGDLKNSLKIKTSSGNGIVRARVVIGNKMAFYAHFIEFGTKPHVIKAAANKLLVFGNFIGRSVLHKGVKPKPFLRNALDSGAASALSATTAYIRKRLEKKHGLKSADESDES